MKLVDEIIDILSSDKGKLSDALIKTKVLLHQIGHKELVSWVNNELNGYSNKNSVPEYRIVPAQVLVNASNLAYEVTAHPIPLGHLENKHRKSIETSKMDQSLAVLEEFVKNKSSHLQVHIPMETYGILGKKLSNGYNIHRAWSEISYTSVTQILIQVRSRLLDFLLELKDGLPNELNEEEAKKHINRVDAGNLFNSAIFGDNTTIVVGNENVQNVSNINLKGDFESLSKTLKSNGVSDSDISELKESIEKDLPVIDDNKREYGSEVKKWLQKMLGKAVDASWQIELAVASSLLATALNSYYGWFK